MVFARHRIWSVVQALLLVLPLLLPSGLQLSLCRTTLQLSWVGAIEAGEPRACCEGAAIATCGSAPAAAPEARSCCGSSPPAVRSCPEGRRPAPRRRDAPRGPATSVPEPPCGCCVLIAGRGEEARSVLPPAAPTELELPVHSVSPVEVEVPGVPRGAKKPSPREGTAPPARPVTAPLPLLI